ncbi:MAG TPA: putative toxin-antitoxin system toxin component, PIN family [Saprospiraceae bacterium]|nr:putative toxin-antitoxin system toxin component, PIN family [Saprospiraceae bacterium]
MKVVIDSNVLLNAIYPRSKNYWIRKALEGQQITLCVTTDILDEYAEVFADYYDAITAELFLSALEILPNILYINKYFFWQLIPQDQDDEKFADCAVAAGAEYLVTNDRHFNHLKKVAFPKINVVNEDEFHWKFEERFGVKPDE